MLTDPPPVQCAACRAVGPTAACNLCPTGVHPYRVSGAPPVSPDPWKDVKRRKGSIFFAYPTGVGSRMADVYEADGVDAARAADALRHQKAIEAGQRMQELYANAQATAEHLSAKLRAAEATIQQQAERIAASERARDSAQQEVVRFLGSGGVSPCGHYGLFMLTTVYEDGAERPECMQCCRDAAQDRADAAEATIQQHAADVAYWKARWASEGDARAQGWTDWTPTPDKVNALPDALRFYIHQLETVCDPSGDTRELMIARDIVKAQELEIAHLKGADMSHMSNLDIERTRDLPENQSKGVYWCRECNRVISAFSDHHDGEWHATCGKQLEWMSAEDDTPLDRLGAVLKARA